MIFIPIYRCNWKVWTEWNARFLRSPFLWSQIHCTLYCTLNVIYNSRNKQHVLKIIEEVNIYANIIFRNFLWTYLIIYIVNSKLIGLKITAAIECWFNVKNGIWSIYHWTLLYGKTCQHLFQGNSLILNNIESWKYLI